MYLSFFRWFLLPFSGLYGLVVGIRNILFDLEILRSRSFEVPVISVGNITVGGTGKTPHIEFLIKALSTNFQIAVLSRGYKRKTKGFVLATEKSDFKEIGDEPMQLKLKYPDAVVAVDENRCRGIEQLMDAKQQPFIDLVLLDDAFQHRAVSSSISILLIDYNRPIRADYLLPVGNLREGTRQMKRAQIIVVTKCPADLKPMELRVLSAEIKPLPYQSLFFSTQTLEYLKPIVTVKTASTLDAQMDSDAENEFEYDRPLPKTLEQLQAGQQPVLLVAGIASPQSLEATIRIYATDVQTLFFSDHHEFGKNDAKKIKQEFEKIRTNNGLIITTEKDAVRMRQNPWLKELLPYIVFPSLEIKFLNGEEDEFLNKLSNYVKINRRNARISQATHLLGT